MKYSIYRLSEAYIESIRKSKHRVYSIGTGNLEPSSPPGKQRYIPQTSSLGQMFNILSGPNKPLLENINQFIQPADTEVCMGVLSQMSIALVHK